MLIETRIYFAVIPFFLALIFLLNTFRRKYVIFDAEKKTVTISIPDVFRISHKTNVYNWCDIIGVKYERVISGPRTSGHHYVILMLRDKPDLRLSDVGSKKRAIMLRDKIEAFLKLRRKTDYRPIGINNE